MKTITFFFLVIFSCCKNSKESTSVYEKKLLNCTTISHFMGDSNFVIGLPNLLESHNTIFQEYEEELYYNFCTFVVGSDTSRVKITSRFDFSFDLLNVVNDSIVLKKEVDKLLAISLNKIVYKKNLTLNQKTYLLVKWEEHHKIKHKLMYRSKYNYIILEFLNVQNESLFYQIFKTIHYEKSNRLQCW